MPTPDFKHLGHLQDIPDQSTMNFTKIVASTILHIAGDHIGYKREEAMCTEVTTAWIAGMPTLL